MSLHITDELLSADVDGALSPEEAAGMAAHVQECAACRQRREMMRATAGAVAALPAGEAPAGLDLSFLPRQAATSRPVVLAPRSWRPPAWVAPMLAAAAVLLVAVTFGPSLLRGGGGASTGASTASRPAAGQVVPDQSQFNGPSKSVPPPAPSPGGAAPALQSAAGLPGASHTYADAGGLVLELRRSVTTASAGQPVTMTVQARAGQPVQLRGLSLQVRQGTGLSTIATSSAPGLASGQQASLSATWTAGQVGGATRPGDYVLEGQAILADGRTFSVSVTIRVN
jgi:anti-sigma factor RsiW